MADRNPTRSGQTRQPGRFAFPRQRSVRRNALRGDAHAAELPARYAFLVTGKTRPPRDGTSPAACCRSGAWERPYSRTFRPYGRIQLYVRKDEVGEAAFADWNDLDRGDLIGVRGYVFRSKMGEITLHVATFRVLGKSLMPLPDKWHGLVDVEKRYRQRYVDIIVNRRCATR